MVTVQCLTPPIFGLVMMAGWYLMPHKYHLVLHF
jgi:hypothetical protein